MPSLSLTIFALVAKADTRKNGISVFSSSIQPYCSCVIARTPAFDFYCVSEFACYLESKFCFHNLFDLEQLVFCIAASGNERTI